MTTPTATKPAANKTEAKPAANRIPTILAKNPIFNEFCQRYMDAFDSITEYNKAVLAERDSEWNAGKVLEKARDLARPTDKNVEPVADVKSALEAYENAVNALAKARKSVLDVTSKELGITLSSTAERNPELEAPLKEKRKIAIEIGTNLSVIANMTNDEATSSAVKEFLEKNPMPAVGRDQTRTFGNDGKSTPKYRVHVSVLKDGTEVVSEDGFTKAALALTKSALGYERGKAPKSDFLRTAWENAGNTPDKTAVSPVEFTDNGLHYVITKK